MKTRTLGSSGLRVSEIGIGCNNFSARLDFEGTRAVVDKAIELGITLFDTADVYGGTGSETFLGNLLGERRKDIVLATKFAMPVNAQARMQGASRHYIMHAVESSLTRLKTDWIDLYQIHVYDSNTPIEETLRALDDLVRSGKVRYIGCSSFPSWRVVEAQWTSKSLGLNSFISCQDHYNLLYREIEKELLPAAQAYNMGLLPYFPLASGALTGKYKRNAPMPEGARLSSVQRLAERYLGDEQWAKIEGLEKFCASRGRSMIELSFSWLATRPQVSSIIAGATSAAFQIFFMAPSSASRLAAVHLA